MGSWRLLGGGLGLISKAAFTLPRRLHAGGAIAALTALWDRLGAFHSDHLGCGLVWESLEGAAAGGGGAATACPLPCCCFCKPLAPMWVARRGRVHQLSSLSLLPACAAQSQQLREAHRGPPRSDEALSNKVCLCCAGCFGLPVYIAPLMPVAYLVILCAEPENMPSPVPSLCSGSGGGSGASRTGSCGGKCRGAAALAGSGTRCGPLHALDWCETEVSMPHACARPDACC